MLRPLIKRKYISIGAGVRDKEFEMLSEGKKVGCWRGGDAEEFAGCRAYFGRGTRDKADLAVSPGRTDST